MEEEEKQVYHLLRLAFSPHVRRRERERTELHPAISAAASPTLEEEPVLAACCSVDLAARDEPDRPSLKLCRSRLPHLSSPARDRRGTVVVFTSPDWQGATPGRSGSSPVASHLRVSTMVPPIKSSAKSKSDTVDSITSYSACSYAFLYFRILEDAKAANGALQGTVLRDRESS
nr:flowering time control protein fpa-like [Ipomoea batatas]